MGQPLDPNTPYGSSRKSEAIRMDYKRSNGYDVPEHKATTQYGSAAPTVAQERPLQVYMGCQYSQHIEATDGHDAKAIPCTNAAMLVPGYYRACTQHVWHQLRRSLLEYIRRPAAVNLPGDEQVEIGEMLKTLALLCDNPNALLAMQAQLESLQGALTNTQQRLEAATTPPAPEKVSKPRAKRATTKRTTNPTTTDQPT